MGDLLNDVDQLAQGEDDGVFVAVDFLQAGIVLRSLASVRVTKVA